MPTAPFSIVVTHSGFYSDGRPNTSSILIDDIKDTGTVSQTQKVSVYVPAGGSISIPMSTSVLFSYIQGDIAKLTAAGLITVGIVPLVGADVESKGPGEAGTWADGTGLGNDITVYNVEYVPPGANDGFLAHQVECVTDGHHLWFVWQVIVPNSQVGVASTDPFVTLHYQLDQAVTTPLALSVRSGPSASETTVSASPGGSTVGSHATLSINWDDLPDGFITGEGQVLEVRADITLDTAGDTAYIGRVDLNWSP